MNIQTVTGEPTPEMQQSAGIRIANNDAAGDSAVRPISMDVADNNPIHVGFSKEAQPSIFDLVPKPQGDQAGLRLNLAAPQ